MKMGQVNDNVAENKPNLHAVCKNLKFPCGEQHGCCHLMHIL